MYQLGEMIHWFCSVCNKIVKPNESGDPESNYWNTEHHQVYCSDKCSLEAHQKDYKLR